MRTRLVLLLAACAVASGIACEKPIREARTPNGGTSGELPHLTPAAPPSPPPPASA